MVDGLTALGVRNEVEPLVPRRTERQVPGDEARYLARLGRVSQDFDLVHIQHEHGLFGAGIGRQVRNLGAALRTLRAARRPVAVTFHTDPIIRGEGVKSFGGMWQRWRDHATWGRHVVPHFACGNAKAVVHSASSRFAFNQAGLPPEAIEHIPHGCLPPRRETLPADEAKASLGLPPGACLLTIFGFLGAYKGQDLAVEALRLMPDDVHLAIVGGMHPESCDHFLGDLLAKAEAFGKRVRVTGYVDSATAGRYFAATDICLAPYRADADLVSSGAVTWALASGRPTIASKIEAFQALRRASDGLFMVTPGNLRELAWAVAKLRADPALGARLAENARRYCLENSWSRTAERTLDLYERLTGRKHVVRPAAVAAAEMQPA